MLRRKLDRPSVVAELLESWDVESKIAQKWWADSAADKKRVRDRIEPLHASFRDQTVTPYLRAWRQHVYKLCVTLLTRARKYASDERRRRNALNYGDLLHLTARVLPENAVVRRALQRKYRYLFVDEFQDTDPVQAEIVFFLAADEELRPPRGTIDWRWMPLRRGALFVVGDPKRRTRRTRWRPRMRSGSRR